MIVPKLLIVVPCYNEEAILHKTHQRLQRYREELVKEAMIAPESKICFVNDGSRDRTWEMIDGICTNDAHSVGVKLSRNFGHQSAILAGLMEHIDDFDCFITIDADLQDDIEAIGKMLDQYRDGAMIVYGVRDDRSTDSWFKRTTAEGFYKLMQRMGVPVVFNHADFRLMDQRILREFAPLIWFRSEKVFYKRFEREAGETKYPLKKMLVFAWNGITSFSTFPMRLVLYFGVFNFLIALAITAYIALSYLTGHTVVGWTSIVLPMTFFSGANMIALGLIGEYIGKIYEEVKGRPRYIVEKKVSSKQ
jgi:polyisoprenyl-phosphate glycosyltransferase